MVPMMLLPSRVLFVIVLLLAHPRHAAAGSTDIVEVIGAGSAAMTLYQSAIFSYSFVQPNVQVIDYGGMTGPMAICRLAKYPDACAPDDNAAQPHAMDWGAMQNPPAASWYVGYPDLQAYPTCANAVVPVYNLNGVTNLVLSMSILAKIYTGAITTWDHPDIQATNQNTFASWNIPPNQRIVVLARQEGSGTTVLFKQALGQYNPIFTSAAFNWTRLVPDIQFFNTPLLMVSYMVAVPYTLGFGAVGDVMGYDLQWAKLNRSGIVVSVSTASVQYAMLEKGLSFGNNGDNPVHLTANLNNALNPLAWPIVSYMYIGVRKSTLRPGATCATVTALMNFWVWFWNSNDVSTMAAQLGFVVLPEVVRDFVLSRFQGDMMCNGSTVWQQAEVPTVAGYGTGSALRIFNQFQQAYALVNSSVVLNYTALASDQVDVTALLKAGGFLVSTTPPPTPGVFSLVLGGELVVGMSWMALNLTMQTLAKIFNGDITTWLDPEIVALNPHGLYFTRQPLANASQRIVLLQGPTASSTALTSLLQSYYPAYTGAAIHAAPKLASEMMLWSALVMTEYSFSVTALVGSLPIELIPTSIMNNGTPVAPSLANAMNCANDVTFNTARQQVTLAPSGDCYPLMLALHISMQRQCPMKSATSRTVTFLQWMFNNNTIEAALGALNILALSGISNAIQAANEEALFQLSCQQVPVVTNLVPLLLAVIIPIAVILLICGSACGWHLWRITEANRIMRKKFSNDNVAESCAEAIARFDLASVAWLKEVKEPNKIQMAFIAIIGLLTEVKPYIPDQLLSQLTAANAEECHLEEVDAELEQRSQSSSQPACGGHPHSMDGTPLQPKKTSFMTEHSHGGASPSPTQSHTCSPRGGSRLTRHFTAASEGARQMLAMRDWRHKRCTYMSVRFGSVHSQPERRLPMLAQFVGNIVDVAKANGATIDAVGVDVVNVHWGVTAMCSALAIRAVQAALEILKLRDALPDDQRSTLWLQMGIGKGSCDCGSVSSATGHRFFVVWGPEASLAIEIAATNLPNRVLTSLLVTPAVHQEVQFTVQCMPRLWHGDALLWEPRCVLKKEQDDEWMYELQKIDSNTTLSNKTLLEVFLLAKGKLPSATDLSARITELRSLHSGKLSAQDTASLDVLLATAGQLQSRDPWMAVDVVAP